MREINSKADRFDEPLFTDNDKAIVERVTQIVRDSIDPSPSPAVYLVKSKEGDGSFLVIDILQGETAHIANDKRFYKRINNIPQAMERYEIIDALHRSKAADLELISASVKLIETGLQDWLTFRLGFVIKNHNDTVSEHGKVQFHITHPAQLDIVRDPVFVTVRIRYFEGGPMYQVSQAERRWSAHQSTAIFGEDEFTDSFHFIVEKKHIDQYRYQDILIGFYIHTPFRKVRASDWHFQLNVNTLSETVQLKRVFGNNAEDKKVFERVAKALNMWYGYD